MQEYSNIDWEDVLDTLEEQKCVLFLGGGVYQAANGGSIENALIDWLDANNPDHPLIRLYNPDGFFLFRKNRFKRKVIASMKDFYNQSFPETEAQFARLAQIPFSMIISLPPDNILARTFDTHGFEYQSDFYFRHRKAPENFTKPTKQKPLIYNLLGNIEEPESLIMTHSDFFDYLDSVFKGNSINEELRYELENAERYIFLGLPYERWYFQLLLRVLSMHSDKLKEVERLALKEFENPHLHELYTEEFKIEFIPVDISGFINDLYQKCKEAEILKPMPLPDPLEATGAQFEPEGIKNLVAEAKTEDAMRQMKIFFDRRKPTSQKSANELIVLRNRFNLLQQREQRGTIYPQDLVVENNQIVEQLLELIAKAESL